MKVETITCAAILYHGVAHPGYAHPEIGHRMLEEGVCKRPFPGGDAQGFLTNTGRFVSRSEAMDIAEAAGQFVRGSSPSRNMRELYSEDIRHLWKKKG